MPTIDNSVILFMAWMASRSFGGANDGMFNSAGFSSVASAALGLPTLDGKVVELILAGRPGISRCGSSHWVVGAED